MPGADTETVPRPGNLALFSNVRDGRWLDRPRTFDGESDDRRPPKERVVALLDGQPLAVPLSLVARRRVVDLGDRDGTS